MNISRFCFAMSLACAPLALAGAAAAQSKQSVASSAVQNGKNLFHANGCWECHGSAGQGGGLAAPRLIPLKLPFQAFLYQLRTPRNQMPPFEAKVVSNRDAADIYAFLKSLPAPPSAASIPLLNN
ncbi:MAG TPA: cytochrome c [Beijerinckiaceae bacterium]|nr:cytochrome c [Beijerinckiaceae bacterium]